jgi:hypothetical protein
MHALPLRAAWAAHYPALRRLARIFPVRQIPCRRPDLSLDEMRPGHCKITRGLSPECAAQELVWRPTADRTVPRRANPAWMPVIESIGEFNSGIDSGVEFR